MSLYDNTANNPNAGVNIWGPGTQTVQGGYWVPNRDGTSGYTFQPQNSFPTSQGGSGIDWTQAGGGAGGSNYGYNYGSTPTDAADPGGVIARTASGQTGQPSPSYPTVGSVLPGYTPSWQNNIDPMFSQGQMDPTMQYMLQNGTSYAAAQNAMSGQPQAPMSAQDLMSQINSYYSAAGVAPQAGAGGGGYDPASQLPYQAPGAGSFDNQLSGYLGQTFNSSLGLNYPNLQPYQSGSGILQSTAQNYGLPQSYGQPTQGSQWTQNSAGNYELSGSLGAPVLYGGGGQQPYGTGTVMMNGVPTQVYVDQQGNTLGPVNQQSPNNAATSGLAGGVTGSLELPAPGGSTIGIPAPQPYNTGVVPPPTPGPAPISPWSINGYSNSGGILGLPLPMPATTASPQPQVLAQQEPAPMPPVGAYDPNNPDSYQYTPPVQQPPAAQTPAAQTAQTQSPANYGNTGMSFQGLLGLLGQIPQMPNLSNIIQAPQVNAQGGFENQPGGQPIRMDIQPVITGQQQQQLINQATANNARQAATAKNNALENMTARGFSSGSGALGATNNQIDAARMMADTNAYSQIPLGAQQQNTAAAMQQMGMNLQGQQNAISGYNAYADLMKNQGNLAAQGYGLALSGYNTQQDALAALLGIGVQQGNLGVQQYLADVTGYNAGQGAQNNYYGNLLGMGNLGLQNNNSYYNNLFGYGNLANTSQQIDNNMALGLINGLLGA